MVLLLVSHCSLQRELKAEEMKQLTQSRRLLKISRWNKTESPATTIHGARVGIRRGIRVAPLNADNGWFLLCAPSELIWDPSYSSDASCHLRRIGTTHGIAPVRREFEQFTVFGCRARPSESIESKSSWNFRFKVRPPQYFKTLIPAKNWPSVEVWHILPSVIGCSRKWFYLNWQDFALSRISSRRMSSFVINIWMYGIDPTHTVPEYRR